MTSKFTILLIILFCCIACQAQLNPYSYSSQKSIHSKNGSVVCAHPLASKVGINILKQGGNAIDASIAVQLALAVVYPGAGNIGGGGFMVAHLNNGKNIALDFREKAPSKAYRDMYLDSAGNPVQNLSLDGHLAVGVPGTVAGLFKAAKYGKLSFKKLIQPAIDLAEKGFVITQSEADNLNSAKENFIRLNTKPSAFVKSTAWKKGDTLVQKDLANTLKRIRDYGQKGFYEGETAKLIVEEMQRGKGLISYDDLKNYSAAERKVMDFNYKGYRILTMPLPSSGGIILQQLLKMIEHRNIAALKFNSPLSIQLITEAERRAYADRAKFLGDPDFVQVPVDTLTSDFYLSQRMKDFVSGKAGNSKDVQAGNLKESFQTTHLSVVDKYGNAVSVTTTLNAHYGSKTVVGGAGFLLNNEMDDFSVKPGVPNLYGAVGNEQNSIAPNKRMLSSMAPTIILKNGQPYIVVGTPGGTTIPTSVFQTTINLLEFNLSAENAVNKPKFHHQWLPDEIWTEPGFDTSVISSLQQMGYKVKPVKSYRRIELITIKNKQIISVADKNGDDDAEGY
ncbi:gamma-glutamyltransferase [Ferruginibacter albus]|uniref:gamma-glutamyltransferase n=1 Tax=Ferruginibacter albus TaxID=2875540 RepID=UPI001CC763EE|nr:gamma-glutamyltransferase [Ferruginibacter albus]UAY51811.1 gamma-glutamyltransferase [Ferruginibacter albus]